MSWLDGRVRGAQGSGSSPDDGLDPRARAAGDAVAETLRGGDVRCVMLIGPGHSGKTQTAMAVREALDPTGTASLHTSAAILNHHARLAPSDRSARWQTWDDVAALVEAGVAPKVVVVDEAGASPAPNRGGFDLRMAQTRRLLEGWAEAGTTFVVIGHTESENLRDWAALLGGPDGVGRCLSGGAGEVERPGRGVGAVALPPDNPVARKNEIGAENRGRMRTPPGNAAFFRGDQWKG